MSRMAGFDSLVCLLVFLVMALRIWDVWVPERERGVFLIVNVKNGGKDSCRGSACEMGVLW